MHKLIFVASVFLVTALAWGGWKFRMFHEAKVAHWDGSTEFESDATEALVKHISCELPKDRPGTLFLAFGKHLKSPSPKILSRFRKMQPAVKDFRRCELLANGEIKDKATGRDAMMVHIIKLESIAAGKYEAEVAIYKPDAAPARFVYQMAKLGGKWVVKNRRPI